jgi:hypothetical protein
MTGSLRKGWLIGGFVFLWLWLPPAAGAQRASIRDVLVKESNGAWKVSFSVENCFTDKMEEAVQTGIPTTFTFHIQVYQTRNWWKDRKIAAVQFQQSIQYNPIGREYQVTFGEMGSEAARVTSSLEEAKRWMARVQDKEVQLTSPVRTEGITYLRIKAELDPVKLPLHLEYLFFFVSLWDFETDWHVETLSP